MENHDYNVKALNDTYKNAHIALQSISDLLPEVEDDDIKKELQEEYEGYEKIIGKISTFMAENGVEPKDINAFKKVFVHKITVALVVSTVKTSIFVKIYGFNL